MFARVASKPSLHAMHAFHLLLRDSRDVMMDWRRSLFQERVAIWSASYRSRNVSFREPVATLGSSCKKWGSNIRSKTSQPASNLGGLGPLLSPARDVERHKSSRASASLNGHERSVHIPPMVTKGFHVVELVKAAWQVAANVATLQIFNLRSTSIHSPHLWHRLRYAKSSCDAVAFGIQAARVLEMRERLLRSLVAATSSNLVDQNVLACSAMACKRFASRQL